MHAAKEKAKNKQFKKKIEQEKKMTESRGVQNPCVHRVCLGIFPLTGRMHPLIVSAAKPPPPKKKREQKSKQGRQRDEQDKTFSAAPDTHFSNPVEEDEFGLGGCRHWAYY